jgi:hypothetical protein
VVPHTRSLLETVEGLVKMADVIRAAGINKPWGLLIVDNFIKSTVEEGILDIKLANRPRAGDGKLQNKPDGSLFDNWTESLIIVKVRTLRVATNDLACFVAGKPAIRVKLLPKDPLLSDNISTRRTKNKGPGFLVEKSLVLMKEVCPRGK